MRIKAHLGRGTPLASPQRRGAVGMSWLLLTCVILVAVLVVVQRSTSQRHLQVELQVTVDSMAHAAVGRLADDVALTEHPLTRDTLSKAARQSASRIGKLNRVLGQPVDLQDNPNNVTTGEIVLGGLDLLKPKTEAFDVSFQDPFTLFGPDLNAVRITLFRRGVAASSLALADHDIVGFRPRPGLSPVPSPGYVPPTVPMVPLAVYSRACAAGEPFGPTCWNRVADSSWEYRILARQGTDQLHYDPTVGSVVAQPDGIPELEILLTEGGGPSDNIQPVFVDPSQSTTNFLLQAKRGISAEDLSSHGGALLLNDGSASENLLFLPRRTLSGETLSQLHGVLVGWIGQPRIWLLYSEVRQDNATGEQVATVVGYVGARLMTLELEQKTGLGSGGGTFSYKQLKATLQPCLMNVPTAVTDSRLRNLGPRPLYNPYLARLRILE